MYEYLKKGLSQRDQSNHFAHGLAGCGATVVHDIVYNPAEVIKQRLQVYATPYRSCLDCARTILAREGWRAFYYSFGTQLLLNIPYNSLHFVTYEVAQDLANPNRDYRPLTHIFSGAVAGAVAAGLTTPFDVCKTLLNTQESSAVAKRGGNIHGIVSAAKAVYRLRGVLGFFSGTTARVVFQIPSTAIAWFVYEFFKYAILREWRRTIAEDSEVFDVTANLAVVPVPTSGK
jgi:solute carrier family 25 iron transporter 28/37